MIRNWFSRLTRKLKGLFSSSYSINYTEDEPSTLIERAVYVIGDKDFKAIAMFACPCGCKQTISLNLMPTKNKPSWSFEDNKGLPTITPSICRKVGCRSHFFLRNGKIAWA